MREERTVIAGSVSVCEKRELSSRGAYRVVELLRSEIVLLEKGGLLVANKR